MPSREDPEDTAAAGESTHLASFDPDDGERASEAVVTAVATLDGTSPVELDPLYDVVEPDALDALITHARRTDATGTHELRFSYEGYDVDVSSDGRIRVQLESAATGP